jgi:YggT family protein
LPLAITPDSFPPVDAFFYAFDALIRVVRIAVFVIALLAAVVFLIDWLVRTRRINPFHPIARAFRQAVQPVLVPIEQRVIRSGGVPSSAPWWALVVVVLAGILLIVLLEFLRSQAFVAVRLGAMGGRGVYYLLVSWTIGILQLALIVRVIASWLRLSEWKPWIRWAVVLTEPILRRLRRLIPPLGMIDITPLVAYFGLWILKSLLLGI